MPSFAELRAKAEAAASTAKEKSQSFTSSSTATKYAPARPSPARKPSKLPPASSSPAPAPLRPPPSPTTSAASASSSPNRAVPAPPYEASAPAPRPPLTPTRTLSSNAPSSSSTFTRSNKPFTQYDKHDKEAMFSALDLFFESRTKAPKPAPTVSSPIASSAPTPRQRTLPPVATIPVPLPPSLPPQAPRAPLSTRPSSHSPSYPPSETYSSSALTLSHYILSTPFSSPWFTNPSSPMPPPLESRSDHQSSFSWQQRNSSKQFIGMTVFGDSSVVWYRISWDVSLESGDPNILLGRIKREARYRPIPTPWDGQRLYEAHELYGPRMTEFARRAVSNGVPVARGECWDLAHEALSEISTELKHSNLQPFVSIGRTHGQLLFWANAEDKERGKWFGGDLYVREGDVVEWRSVTIREAGMAQGSYSILGDPDHTAIIVGTGSPTSLPEPSDPLDQPVPYSPSSLGSLTVVEQSLGQVPTERTYDLSTFSKGEIWIYRPCGMQALLGVDKVEAIWPTEKGIESWQVGEL